MQDVRVRAFRIMRRGRRHDRVPRHNRGAHDSHENPDKDAYQDAHHTDEDAYRDAHDSHEDPDEDAYDKDAYKDAHVDPDEDAVALPHAATLTTLQDVLQRQVQGSV